MKADYTKHARRSLDDLPVAKKYDESQDLWQARVNKDWRFYFQIREDVYYIVDIIPHPK